jgi:tellurite resistance protein
VKNIYMRSAKTATELATKYLDHHDDEVLQALVTAGALVALSDGQVKTVERDELVNFIDQQGFVPTVSRQEIADAFDNRLRQLEDRQCNSVLAETLRPLAGLSLASVVVRVADRVAAADGKIHAGELRALRLIRMVMMTLPSKRPHATDASRSKMRHMKIQETEQS